MIKEILILLLIIVLSILFVVFFPHIKRMIGGQPIDIWNKYRPVFDEVVSQTYNAKLKLDELNNSLQYIPSVLHSGRSVHRGQLKLLLMEVEFLTMYTNGYYENFKDKDILIVYAGSAPGHSQDIIHWLFPNVRSFLIDPNQHEFSKLNDSNISIKFDPNADSETIKQTLLSKKYSFYVLENLFTDELSTMLYSIKDSYDILFCSDIRTAINSNKKDSFPVNLDVLWNSSQQYNGIKIMQPKAYALKFRPFYGFDEIEVPNKDFIINCFETSKKFGIDFVSLYQNKEFMYFNCDIYLQAFAGEHSSEVRLVGSDINNTKSIDIKEIDNKMFYYNNFERIFGYHNDNKIYHNPNTGIDGCGDCSVMCKIVSDYVAKINSQPNSPSFIAERSVFLILDKMIEFLTSEYGNNLLINKHGRFFSNFTGEPPVEESLREHNRLLQFKNKRTKSNTNKVLDSKFSSLSLEKTIQKSHHRSSHNQGTFNRIKFHNQPSSQNYNQGYNQNYNQGYNQNYNQGYNQGRRRFNRSNNY